MKDAIRRRSENDVLICVAPVAGHSIDPVNLIAVIKVRMAYVMVLR
jgi:hypothetical protein